MKGKKIFTQSEAKEIRLLIQKKIESSPDKQKGIRKKIRDIGFFYSDFSSKKNGYTTAYFDSLISSSTIKII